eukprot:CAMPEP_0117761160 /NCGR_PEP_ID=MMETSP0947-20121206/17103_1 /TAXON_ID=44440 /ORGANISM="Chattonella subsalsa, Strain CCMP2191" /LENGTH=216 /DNA_ID=CAMNT_0005582075 /DNA_START=235 /DNA_END=882 /DNA_ORIENTATION=+
MKVKPHEAVSDDRYCITIEQPIQSPQGDSITVDQPIIVAKLPQGISNQSKKYLVVANSCKIRKTPSTDSPEVGILPMNSIVDVSVVEPAYASHPLVLSQRRVRVVSPLCGYASLVDQNGREILQEIGAEGTKPTYPEVHDQAFVIVSDDRSDLDRIMFASIFSFLCCMWPCGLVATYYACNAYSYHASRNYEEEQKALGSAKTWATVSFVGGFIVW